MKFDFFLTLFENSLKKLYKIQQLAFIPHKPQRLIITATKWAIIDFLTCLLQKVINNLSSWSSTFSSLSWKILWKICLKSKNWHLFLHKLTRCIITAKKVYNRLSNLSSSKVINKRSSWSSTFFSLSWKIL